jgi:hypothetical protein
VTHPVYVYGVVAAADAAAVAVVGVDGCTVRTVCGDRLGALVSDLDAVSLSAARAVRAHWRVLDRVAEQATVVPARFGTILEDDAAVRRDLLAANAEHLQRLLTSLTARVQLKVEGRYDEERLLRAIVEGSPGIAALRRRVLSRPEAAGYYDRIRLGETIVAAVERRRAADTGRARAVLAPLAEADRVEEARTPDAAFKLSFLVARERVDAFSAGVAALRDELGDAIAIRYVGPLPAYSFAEVELRPAEAA